MLKPCSYKCNESPLYNYVNVVSFTNVILSNGSQCALSFLLKKRDYLVAYWLQSLPRGQILLLFFRHYSPS